MASGARNETVRATAGRDGTRVAQPLAQALFGAGCLVLAFYNFRLFQIGLTQNGNDFGKFYWAVTNWQQGHSLYEPTIATHMLVGSEFHELLNMNPPHFHFLIWPLVGVGLTSAAVTWSACNLALAALAGVIVARELHVRVASWHVLPALTFVLASASTSALLGTGQVTGVLLLPLVLAWRSARQGRSLHEGVALGALMSLKPFLGLFGLVFIMRRDYRALLSCALTGAAACLLGTAVFGAHAYAEWFGALGDVRWAWAAMNGSIEAVLVRAFQWSPYYVPVAHAPEAVRPLWLLLSAVVVSVTAWASRRSIDHAYAATVLAALLVSPLGWVYYHWLALPGCWSLWRGSAPRLAIFGLMALCTPIVLVAAGPSNAALTLTVGSAYTWATIALWLGVIRSQPLGDAPAAS